MASSKLSETPIGREVERLFGEISAKRGDLCENPVTGGEFVYGFDPIQRQKKMAYHALLAREDFARMVLPTHHDFPLEHWECERAKMVGRPLGLPHRAISRDRIVAQYDVKAHPSFDDYASGVLWEHDNVAGSALPFYA